MYVQESVRSLESVYMLLDLFDIVAKYLSNRTLLSWKTLGRTVVLDKALFFGSFLSFFVDLLAK